MSLATTAQRLIQTYGRTITIVKTTETPADGAKPWRGPAALTTGSGSVRLSLFAVFEERSESELARALAGAMGGGRDIPRRGNARFLAAALDIVGLDPKEGDFIEDGTTAARWAITRVETVQPGADKILYIFEVAQ